MPTRSRNKRRRARRSRARNRSAAVPKNVTHDTYWFMKSLAPTPPALQQVGPVRRRIAVSVTASTSFMTTVAASKCFTSAWGTDGYTTLTLHSVAAWTSSPLGSEFAWLQLSTVRPDTTHLDSSNQLFTHTAPAVNARARVGYHVPDVLGGTYSSSSEVCAVRSSSSTVLLVISATFFK